jgi:ATP-dependent protease Clp ATPase subunit
LKIIEGTEARVSMQGNRKHPSSEMILLQKDSIKIVMELGLMQSLKQIVLKKNWQRY